MTLTASSFKTLGRGDSAPQFRLSGTDDKEHSLEDYSDTKALLIVFMCNHCPYVRPKLAFLNHLQKEYAPQGLRVVGINANDAENYPEDNLGAMKEASQQDLVQFDYLFDEAQEVPKAYGATCTPDPFLFDADHKLFYHGRIDDAHGKPHAEASTNELERAIQDLLKGNPVSVQSLPSMGCNIKWKD